MTLDDDMKEDFQNHVSKLRDSVNFKSEILGCIPSNWCDPLLTGPGKVLPDGYSYSPQDIEKLLNAIRKRLEKTVGI